GSAKPMKSSYKDGTAAAEACALMILNLLEVKNRHFTYERRRELKSPGGHVATAYPPTAG
ncbi:MAG: hypothetical protein NTW87_00160, partial [Planctomycetota bacterium]|nr:hypothetical protein [Planctomycetota bacterium]